MSVKKVIFWSHLVTGIVAGVFVLIMSVTGVLLTYEHAIISAFADRDHVQIVDGSAPLALDEIARIARDASPPETRGIMLSITNREDAPLTVYQLGHGQLVLNPYTGDPVEAKAAGVEAFFHTIVSVHRWLGAEGASRKVARAITGASNLLFLFLVISGLYLWFPKVWKWSFFKLNLLFRTGLPTAKARDYNWHHVFGVWALLPLFFIVTTGAVMSYPWANAALYQAFGEEAPKRQGPPFMGGGSDAVERVSDVEQRPLASLQNAFETAAATDGTWTKINLIIPPKPDMTMVRVMVNNGGGYLAEQRTTHMYSLREHQIVKTTTYSDMGPGQKARMFVRFLHTGEQFGLIGSTIAGLASLAACFLVYTGFALSYRRLIMPLLRRRRRT